MGEEDEEDLNFGFVLHIDMDERGHGEKNGSDLVQFCSVNARERDSTEFMNALTRIAAMDTKMQPDKPGVGVQIPVRVCFALQDKFDPAYSMSVLQDVVKAEKVIIED
ncbi:uncharacterized protein IUM83_17554 [Phytophthora cinnamomi]|uniref:uncharacterized protein n=1 Tax=Phytophthora cinnamomi TaxID=4785 RepID=UPI00355A3D0F|nr:hypothetical protein IUM83_17554 [Phytophthora cinnamomi]